MLPAPGFFQTAPAQHNSTTSRPSFLRNLRLPLPPSLRLPLPECLQQLREGKKKPSDKSSKPMNQARQHLNPQKPTMKTYCNLSILIALTTALIVSALPVGRAEEKKKTDENKVQLMFVQTADDLKTDGDTLRLVNIGQQTLY